MAPAPRIPIVSATNPPACLTRYGRAATIGPSRNDFPHHTLNVNLLAQLRGIIFDYGNTLIGLRPPIRSTRTDYADVVAVPGAERLAEHLRREGILSGAASVRAFVERFLAIRERDRAVANDSGEEITGVTSLAAALGALGHPVPGNEALLLAVAEFYGPELEAVEALPGAMEMLDGLKERGARVALLSNATSGAYVDEAARRLGMRDHFDPFFVSADLGYRKPLERVFRAVVDCWQLPPAEIAMVGDSLYHDIAGAERLGIQTIHFTALENAGDAAYRDRVRPDAVARTHAELARILIPLLA